ERLTKGANIPYFFSAGNHDVTSGPPGDPQRAIGLHNTLTAISRLIPPEGSPRRLNGYPTYAFGYGNAFFIALDSHLPSPRPGAVAGPQRARTPRGAPPPSLPPPPPPPAVFVGSPQRRVGRSGARHRREGARSRRSADDGAPDALHADVPQAPRAADRRG